MNEKIRKVKCRGELNLVGYKIPCYNLEDGTRILSGRQMQNSLKMTDEDDKQSSGTRLDRYLNQKTLQPYIYKGKKAGHYDPIICYDGEKEIHGQEAGRLVDFCEGILEAKEHIKLSHRQTIIADQSRKLLGAFAKVGIYALIDEVTGYQYEREQDELQKQLNNIFKLYVLDKPQKWEKIFPWTFYNKILVLNISN